MFIINILRVAKREVCDIFGDKLYITILLWLPIAMILFFTLMFYRGVIYDLPVVVVDRDNSLLSRKLISMIDATPGVNASYQVSSIDDAMTMFQDGKAYGVVYIDDGFEAGIYRGVTVGIECFVSGTNISASGVVERDVQQVVRTFSAGVSMEKLETMGVSHDQAFIEVMPVNIQTNIVGNPYLNYGYYLAPIFMIMGVIIFTMLSTVYSVGRELRYATSVSWLERSGGSIGVALCGKLMPITITMFVLMQMLYLILFVFMGMECAGSYLMLTLVSLCFIIAYQSVAVLVITLTANLRLALSLAGGYAVMAFTFSGITFPTIAMFGVARVLSKCFPMTYFSEIFISQAMRGAPLKYDIVPMIMLLLFILMLPISLKRLKVVSLNSQYWKRD